MEFKEIGELYDQHASQLKKFICNRVGSEEDAEDILHESFMRMSNANSTLKISDTRKYLFTIARNIIIDRSRRPKLFVADPSKEDYLSECASEEPSPDHRLSIQSDLKVLEEAVMSLSSRCQQAFVMRVFYGYSHNEISRHMDISVKTVEKHLTKGFMVCRQHMTNADAPNITYGKGKSKLARLTVNSRLRK